MRPHGRAALFCLHVDQFGLLGVVALLGDRSVADALDGFVDHLERDQEPFARLDGMTKSVLDLDLDLGGSEDPVQQIFEPRAVDPHQGVGGDHLDLGKHVGRFVDRIGDAGLTRFHWLLASSEHRGLWVGLHQALTFIIIDDYSCGHQLLIIIP